MTQPWEVLSAEQRQLLLTLNPEEQVRARIVMDMEGGSAAIAYVAVLIFRHEQAHHHSFYSRAVGLGGGLLAALIAAYAAAKSGINPP